MSPGRPRLDIITAGMKILIVWAFFVTGLIDFGVIPSAVAWLTELVVILMLLEVMRQKRLKRERWFVLGRHHVAAVLAICILSTLWNDTSAVNTLLFLRKFLRFYVLMVVIANSAIDNPGMQQIMRIVSWLLILQIPVAVARVFIFGQGEMAVGTYAYHSGGPSTTIPMVAVAFLLAYHVLYRRSVWNLLLMGGFVAFGIAGGKRGIIVLVPAALLFTSACIRLTVGRRLFGRLGIIIVAATLIGGSASFYAVARLVPTFNPEQKFWGSFSMSYAVGKLQERLATEDHRNRDVAHRRVAATAATWQHLSEGGAPRILLGDGPGYYMKNTFDPDNPYFEKLHAAGIDYGVTGVVWMSLQMGLGGMVAWMLFYGTVLSLLKKHAARESDPYWKAHHVGMMGVTLVAITINLIYNRGLLTNDLVSLLYMLGLAFSVKRILLSHEAAGDDPGGGAAVAATGQAA